MNKLVKTGFTILVCFTIFSCSKPIQTIDSSTEVSNVSATFQDYTGLDGCGWILITSNGNKLEPANLSELEIKPQEGKKVTISYQIMPDMMSICMVGQIVKITNIKEQ